MVFSVVKNRICFRDNTWEENLFPDNNNKVLSSGRKPEEPGSNLGHPRRPRDSQSGRKKRRDESFQAWAEEPLGTFLGDPGAVSRVGKGGTKVCKYGQKRSSRLLSRPDCWLPLVTDSHRIISKRSSECWLLIGHKKLLCIVVPNRRKKLSNCRCVRTTTVTATKTPFKKWSRAASSFIALIPFCSFRQLLTIFSGAEFWKTVSIGPFIRGKIRRVLHRKRLK